MKKLLILVSIVALAACDNSKTPKYQANDLVCGKDVYTLNSATVYSKKADVVINGKEIELKYAQTMGNKKKSKMTIYVYEGEMDGAPIYFRVGDNKKKASYGVSPDKKSWKMCHTTNEKGHQTYWFTKKSK